MKQWQALYVIHRPNGTIVKALLSPFKEPLKRVTHLEHLLEDGWEPCSCAGLPNHWPFLITLFKRKVS